MISKMINRSKLTDILRTKNPSVIALRTKEELKSDCQEIDCRLKQIDLARERLNLERSSDYLNVRNSLTNSAKEFYDKVYCEIKQFYGSQQIMPEKLEKTSWGIKGDFSDRDLAFKYRVFLRKEDSMLREEVENIEFVLDSLHCPEDCNVNQARRNFEKSLNDFYKFVDSDFRRVELKK